VGKLLDGLPQLERRQFVAVRQGRQVGELDANDDVPAVDGEPKGSGAVQQRGSGLRL